MQVIIDGDWGGDEMQLAAVLLAHPEHVEILGATCTFGNTDHAQVVRNALNILHFLKADPKLEVHPGALKPSDTDLLPGDGAHGGDGIGNVDLPPSPHQPSKQQAVDFLLEQLRSHDPGTVTITASGPLTNIADALRRDRVTMSRVDQVIIMGGCTHDMPAHDVPVRRGNITYQSEFNFFQAAIDAALVMSSGLSIVLLPMNCTHQLTLTSEREEELRQTLSHLPTEVNQLIGMMTAPAAFDRTKFNIDPVMHDIHCALYLLFPEGYETVRGRVTVTPPDQLGIPDSRTGHTDFNDDNASPVTVALHLKDPNRFWQIFLDSIRHCLSR